MSVLGWVVMRNVARNIKVMHKNPNAGLVVDVWTCPPNPMTDLFWFESG